MQPSDKSPAVEDFLEKNFGRTTAIKSLKCVAKPVGCGNKLEDTNFAKANNGQKFRDELSAKEYTISGLCQDCQDDFFGRPDEPDDASWLE
jgi:hypothetical protein